MKTAIINSFFLTTAFIGAAFLGFNQTGEQSVQLAVLTLTACSTFFLVTLTTYSVIKLSFRLLKIGLIFLVLYFALLIGQSLHTAPDSFTDFFKWNRLN